MRKALHLHMLIQLVGFSHPDDLLRDNQVGDLFKRSLMALYLLRVLEMTPFFYNGGSDPRNVALKDKVMMGAVVLKHLQNLPCNAHELSEMELPPPSDALAVCDLDTTP